MQNPNFAKNPFAKKYLIQYIWNIAYGKEKRRETDVRGTVTLIHKKGDKNDPANYRSIALLNSNYKFLTATISSYIQENLSKGTIPEEQLARKGVWGTMHGMLMDKNKTTWIDKLYYMV